MKFNMIYLLDLKLTFNCRSAYSSLEIEKLKILKNIHNDNFKVVGRLNWNYDK